MKLALVHHHLYQMGGSEKVLLVLGEIYPEAPIFTLLYDQKNLKNLFKDKIIKTSFFQKLPFGIKKFKWYLPLMPLAFENFNLSSYDVIISNDSSFAKGIIPSLKTLHICYCQTPTRFLWSDTHSYIEELSLPKIIKKILPLFLSRLRIWDYLASQRPDIFIANSQFTAQRIKKYYHRESIVIYPPVETEKFKVSPEVDKYFLLISRLMPYKKVDLAISAFNKLKVSLKIIGTGEDEKRLKKMAKKNIEFLGEISDEKKADYLSRCQALIHPQEEDFGLTVVEAMASGRPVIAYRSGGALETVIENENGLFFDEQCWESLANAVIRFKPKKFNPLKIREHAQKFGKERFKKEMGEFVERKWREYKRHATGV